MTPATPPPSRLEIVRRPGARPFPPRVSTFTRPYWDALSVGRLITSCCVGCGRLSFPPKSVCRECWSEAVAWQDLLPTATLYSYTRLHIVPGAFRADAPYDIGIVDLADGLRLMCRIMPGTAELKPDIPVTMLVLMHDDGPLLAARPCR